MRMGRGEEEEEEVDSEYNLEKKFQGQLLASVNGWCCTEREKEKERDEREKAKRDREREREGEERGGGEANGEKGEIKGE